MARDRTQLQHQQQVNNILTLILRALTIIMSQLDDLRASEASLKTELDAAKARDEAIQASLADVQKQLADLIANPPSGPDLTSDLQALADDIAEAQSIGVPPTPPAPENPPSA